MIIYSFSNNRIEWSTEGCMAFEDRTGPSLWSGERWLPTSESGRTLDTCTRWTNICTHHQGNHRSSKVNTRRIPAKTIDITIPRLCTSSVIFKLTRSFEETASPLPMIEKRRVLDQDLYLQVRIAKESVASTRTIDIRISTCQRKIIIWKPSVHNILRDMKMLSTTISNSSSARCHMLLS